MFLLNMLFRLNGLIHWNEDPIVNLDSRGDPNKGSQEAVVAYGYAINHKAMFAITRTNVVTSHGCFIAKYHIIADLDQWSI